MALNQASTIKLPVIQPEDRERIKGLVPTGDTEGIHAAITNGFYKRKMIKVASVDKDARQITFRVMSDTVDRDSERVMPRSIEKYLDYYLENPVVLYNHDHSIPAIGKMVDYKISDTEVEMTDLFAPDSHALAKVLWELYSADDPFMRMTSIGFIPIETSKKEEDKLDDQKGLTYKEIEIIEHSCVNVGSNRLALSKAPAQIRQDPQLKTIYEALIEEPEALSEKPDTTPNDTAPQPIIINIPKGTERLSLNVSDTPDTPQPDEEVETKMATQKTQHPEPQKGTFVGLLNKEIDAFDDPDGIVKDVAEALDVEIDALEAVLDGGEIEGIDEEAIEEIAEIVEADPDELIAAATADAILETEGDTEDPDADDADDDTDDDDEDVNTSQPKAYRRTRAKRTETRRQNRKYYGYGGKIKDTYESRMDKIRKALPDYVETEMSDEIEDRYGFGPDIAVTGTKDTEVLFYCWDTGKDYKADYTVNDDGTVAFDNLMMVEFDYSVV